MMWVLFTNGLNKEDKMGRLGSTFFRQSQFESRTAYFASDSMLQSESSILKSQSPGKTYDVFISHSSTDRIIAINFYEALKAMGIVSYIDWLEDSDVGRDSITSALRTAMNNSRVLIYLHTHNSRNSKWTPWEIGYFDSKKDPSRIGVAPLLDGQGNIPRYDGQEYLKQYNEIGVDYLKQFVQSVGRP